jgi:class 3 adenylate cyclase
VDFAVEMQQIVDRFNAANGTALQVRVGVDAGTVSSGLVGRENVAYDLWGDAVDVANAIHATAGEPGVFVSDRVYERLRDTASYEQAGAMPDGTAVWRWTGEARRA